MSKRALVIALIVSVVANLALIGFLIGTSGGPPGWRSFGFDVTAGFGRLVRFLPDERRSEVLGGIDVRRDIRASLRTMREAQHAIEEAMAAEPFDPAALTAALEGFRGHFTASQQESHAAFVTIMERLTPAERQEFVESMRHMRDPRRHRDRHGDRGRERDERD